VKPLRAILSVGFLALCAGRCDPPFGDPEGHTILYLLALPENVSYTFPPEATVRDAMDEVAAYFLDASYGVHVAQGAVNPLAPGDLVGPVQSQETFACDSESAFVSGALYELGSTLDFRPYEHVVVLAPGLGCTLNGEAIGMVGVPVPGGGSTWVRATYANAQSVFAGNNGAAGPGIIVHELGHWLDLDHSRALLCDVPGVVLDVGCDDGEYLDLIDVMGASIFFGHFNAFQKENVGWLPPVTIQDVTESGQYHLSAYEVRSQGPKALRIRRQLDSYLYVEYRTPRGFDNSPFAGFTNGAVFHLVQPLETGGDLQSFLLRGPSGEFALAPGATMQDWRGHVVTVLSRSANGLLLDVQLASAAELVPPTFTTSLRTSPLPGHLRISVTAQDPSGIDAVELYTKTFGFTSFEWDEVDFLEIVSGGGATPFQVNLDMAFADIGDALEMAVYDGVGNVPRRTVY
jgi:hypothetical protein